MNKELMIQQGYVPTTCVMPDPPAGMLIFAEISDGRDPCAGCNYDPTRETCKGRPKVERRSILLDPMPPDRPYRPEPDSDPNWLPTEAQLKEPL